MYYRCPMLSRTVSRDDQHVTEDEVRHRQEFDVITVSSIRRTRQRRRRKLNEEGINYIKRTAG